MKYIEFSNLSSIALYIVVVVSVTSAMHMASLTDDGVGSRNKYVNWAVIFAAAPSMLRFFVGNDYEPLYNLGLQIARTESMGYAIAFRSNVETSFSGLMYILGKLSLSPSFGIALYGLLTQILFIKGIWNYRNYAKPEAVTLMYMCGFYWRTYNLFRQLLAVAIIFWAIRYIFEKKYVRYIIFAVIATIVHRSALVSFLLVWIYGVGKKNNAFLTILNYILPVVAIFGVDRLYSMASNIPVLARYVREYSSGERYSVLTLGTILVGFEIILYVLYRIQHRSHIEDEAVLSKLDLAYFYQVLLYFLGFTFTNATRIVLYFSVFGYCSLAMVCGNEITRYREHKFTFYQIGYFMACLASLISVMSNNGYGQLPYRLLIP